MQSIGMTIRRLRKERNITQEELSEAVGVTPQAVSKWENDAGLPDISQLVPLANYFQVSIDTLFCRNEITVDHEVERLLTEIDEKSSHATERFEKYLDALKTYPHHPALLHRILRCAEWQITAQPTPHNARLLTEGLKATDLLIRHSQSPSETVRVKESRVRLLARAGRYAEAEECAKEFEIPLLNNHSLLACICHEQKDYPAEIRHRQESIARLAVALADEISHLGIAYRGNQQYTEAAETHSVNLQLPYTLHRDGKYHAPLMNIHAISGFDAAYCLVLAERYEDALTLLERIFDYAEEQCPYSTNRASLTSSLFNGIDMTPFHGESLLSDYLHHIQNPAFQPLHDHPRFQILLKRYATMP